MAARSRDIDYLVVSARIRAMENQLLTRGRMEQLLEARGDEEVEKLLQECGYPQLDAAHPERMDAALAAARQALWEDLASSVPDPRYLDIFKIKYDYHNGKAVLKAAAMGTDPTPMLLDAGRVPAEEVKGAILEGNLERLPPRLAEGVAEAKEVLDTTRDPQLCDTVLDRWCYANMTAVAGETGSQFLQGYVKIQIDAINLRTLVRALRMGKNPDFLRGILFEGGEIDQEAILKTAASGGGGLAELYAPTLLAGAAEEGASVLRGGALTAFEKKCDDGVTDYLAGAQLIPFGEGPLVSYLAARETEYTNLRILLLGRSAGLAPDVIRSRLRESFA